MSQHFSSDNVAGICADTAHVEPDECGALELFFNGAKLLVALTTNGKLTPADIQTSATQRKDIHFPKPRVVTMTQATETGRIYSLDEARAIGDICRQLGLSLRSDGARFANACASLKYSPAEMTWRSGVDVLCFGGTKNGLALGEAVLFFDRTLSTDFAYRCKQAGQLASKMRFVAAPWVRTFETGTWLTNARHANASALRFAHGIAGLAGVELIAPVEANAVFLSMGCARRADRRPGQRCLRSRHVGRVLRLDSMR